jgi:hypothetical protein
MPNFFRRPVMRNFQDASFAIIGGAWMGYAQAIHEATNEPSNSLKSVATLIFILGLNSTMLRNLDLRDVAEMSLVTTLSFIAGYTIGYTALPLPSHLRLEPHQINRYRPA